VYNEDDDDDDLEPYGSFNHTLTSISKLLAYLHTKDLRINMLYNAFPSLL
jgi:hypothetical protein